MTVRKKGHRHGGPQEGDRRPAGREDLTWADCDRDRDHDHEKGRSHGDLKRVTVGQQTEKSSPGLTVTVIVTIRKVPITADPERMTVGQQAESSPGLTMAVIVTMTVRKVAVTADPERMTGSRQASAQQQNNLQTHCNKSQQHLLSNQT
jgi:hypothetical protein